MRTTINLDDDLLRAAKVQAAERSTTLTALITQALRRELADSGSSRSQKRIQLRTFAGSGVQPGIDLADNASVRDAMDGLR
jgi:Arc/MetJ family transcription regulator